jgi:hypothetical protein
MSTLRFERVAAYCAGAAAVLAVFYSVAFAVVVKEGSRCASWSSTSALALGGLVALPVIVAIYLRVRAVDEGFALVGLLVRSGLPARFATLGYTAAALLVVVYVGRLTVLDPNKTWIATAAVASGFVAVPAWYAWLARTLIPHAVFEAKTTQKGTIASHTVV